MLTAHQSKPQPIVTPNYPFSGCVFGTSFGLKDIEAPMNVAFEAKELIAVHKLKH